MRRIAVFVGVGVLLAALDGVAVAISNPVAIDTGALAGAATGTGGVTVFKGIPYAAPPVGANRWRAPQPAAKWNEVRAADAFGNRCIAGGGPAGGRGRGAPGAAPVPGARGAAPATPPAARGTAPAPPPQPPASEDCLYLNVWTSAAGASDRRPVMVWIYGGGFTGGAGSEPRYDGERLAAKGPVVVTFNYRLGQFGFFAHPELTKESGRHASGNYGMMDAIAALRWVKRNIAAFGGDPDNVTIFGESAGANMTSALVGSPAAKGLFHRAIAQSSGWMGLGLAAMPTLREQEEAGVKAATAVGATSLAELRAKSTEEIGSGVRGPVRLIVDGYLIPEDLSRTFSRGRQNEVDVLVGSNQDEGTFFGAPPAADRFTSQAREKYGEMADGFLRLYPAGSDEEARTSHLASFSDEMSWHMRLFAQAQVRRGKNGYVYSFTRVPRTADGSLSPRGATHTVEIQYAFNNPTGQQWDEVDRKLAETMSSYWVNFATKGDPNGPGLPTWPLFRDMTSGRAMVLGDTVQVESTSPAAKLIFFDAAYARLLN